MLGSHSHNPHICCVSLYPGALAAMRALDSVGCPCVLRKGIGKMKMPPKCQGAIGDLIKGHRDRQVIDGWPVAKNHFH